MKHIGHPDPFAVRLQTRACHRCLGFRWYRHHTRAAAPGTTVICCTAALMRACRAGEMAATPGIVKSERAHPPPAELRRDGVRLHFRGAVDEVAIFDQALDDDEVQSLAAGPMGCQPGG